MKRFLIAMFVMLLACTGAMAQSAADKIVGNYKVIRNGQESKVKVFKYNGGYRAQVYWLKEPNNPDGTPKRDVRNSDKSKRNVLSTQIVLVDKVVYKDGCWKDGRIYDPTKGDTFNVVMKFENDKTLKVKGNWGPFSSTSTWTKIN